MRNIYLFSTSAHPDAISINSLEIALFKPEIDFSSYDYIIVTSKQALNALKQYNFNDFHTKKLLCISKATANAAKKMGLYILEVGEGYGDNLSTILKKYPKSKKWLYLRAEIIASDFAQKSQNDGYNISEITVYKSECSQMIADVNTEENSILIFTSPSSVKCFLKHHTFSSRNSIIVIGKTTAKAIPQKFSYTLAEEPTIEACLSIINL